MKIQNSRQNAGKCSPPGGQYRLLRVGEGGHDVVELVLERGEGGVEAAHRGLGVNSIDIMSFGHESGHETGPSSAPNSVLGPRALQV